jgi:hypothetical protein
MEFTLKNHIMVDLGQEFCELLEDNYSNQEAYAIMKDKVRNEYDGEIWDMVDDEENTLEMDFDDILSEIMEEVESKGNYYHENNQAGN